LTDRQLTLDTARNFSRLALAHVQREYPNLLYHVLNGPADARTPRELHPVFFGSMDWHSCVHGYWLLATLRRLFPGTAEAREAAQLFTAQLTPEKISVEIAYLRQPLRGIFERPYGWAWLLMLAAELARHTDRSAAQWRAAIQPLTDEIRTRFLEFLPKATYPTRVGTHFSSAFALTLALEYAEGSADALLRTALIQKAVGWYVGDTDCQAWEPSGDDFLSPALMEATCMKRVLAAADFLGWLNGFLPRLATREPTTLFVPATVSDRSDGKIAHLDGLNLSRAWCWRSIASALPPTDSRRAIALEAAAAHLDASLPHVAGDYAGEHWLATFALLALL
jgi:Protein of unknown function (DUF2891)